MSKWSASSRNTPKILQNKILQRRKVNTRFRGIIWEANLAEMRSLSSFNCGAKYLLCIIDVSNKYAWVKPLKDKKAETVPHGFIEIINQSKCKPNKLWVGQAKEFYDSFMKK